MPISCASTVTPTKNAIRIAAIQTCVVAAFFDSGGWKLGTPLATASIPVRAAQPDANARSKTKRLRACIPGSMAFSTAAACRSAPKAIRISPMAIMPPKLKMKK